MTESTDAQPLDLAASAGPPAGGDSLVDGLTFERATAADAERIIEIVAGNPGQEAIGISGGADRARAFGMAMMRLPGGSDWEHTVLAKLGGETVGVLQFSEGAGGLQVTPRLALLALRFFGPFGVLRLVPRIRARGRVQTRSPAGAYHVSELDVDPSYRNRGIGGALLDYAETEARSQGRKVMSLSTTTANPARRLYERHGFRVVQTLTDAEYERITGIAGRLLMVKELD